MKNVLYIDEYDENKIIYEKNGWIIAKGGDGTLIRAISLFSDKKLPFYGSAAGTANFLMNAAPRSWDVKPKIKKFKRIKVTIITGSEVINHYAFNDLMIGGDMNTFAEFTMKEKDELFGTFKGGGIIISTPQGSTGVNRANSGGILPLSSNLWSVTGDKTNRPIDYVIKPRHIDIGIASRVPITVWVDGNAHIIQNVLSVSVEPGDTVKVIFDNYSEFKKKRRI